MGKDVDAFTSKDEDLGRSATVFAVAKLFRITTILTKVLKNKIVIGTSPKW